MGVTVVHREGEFSFLRRYVGGFAVNALEWVHASGKGSSDSTHASVVLHHDVQNVIRSLCVLEGTWVGDDLYALYHACRHGFQHLADVLAGKRWVWMAVAVDFVVGRTSHQYIVLSVNAHHRHFAQHVQSAYALGLFVVLNIVGKAVHANLDELALSDYGRSLLVFCSV